jgi:NADPH-dependent 2,4-dienoyl-CoA reductase/sulfur reductase-like enzyme/rhodanese-related sulfurtransferase
MEVEKMKVLIIGGVAGGASAAARLRRLDESAQIVLLERSGYVSYANCGLPYYIGGVIKDKGYLTLQTPESFRERFNVDVRVRNEAVAIHTDNKTVEIKDLDSGKIYEESYDKLILSPGAKAVKPEMEGIHSDRIFTLRTVEDTYRIREFIDEHGPKRAVVVGGGFIGLEMAENLIHQGIETTLLQRSGQVMPPLDADMAFQVHAYLRKKGLDLRLNTPIDHYEDREDRIKVVLKEKDPIEADMVILGIGVLPETTLAKEAGLALAAKDSILVNDKMETSVPDVYAVGDAVEVKHFVTGQQALIALAGPANKQGRIAADNIMGRDSRYAGSQGSSVIKLFDMTVATTGINEKTAQKSGVKYDKVVIFPPDHAVYYPDPTNMMMKTLFDPDTGKILGAQIVGFGGVDKRIDVMATAIRAGMTGADLEELDLAYAPPYSSAKDPVNMTGFTIENVRSGLVRQFHWEDLEKIISDENAILLDVRTDYEVRYGHLPGSTHIPVDELRERMDELDKSKDIFLYCQTGLRSYVACRMLAQNGYRCSHLSGGFEFYTYIASESCYDEAPAHGCGVKIVK